MNINGQGEMTAKALVGRISQNLLSRYQGDKRDWSKAG
jgi:hypothetical protein